MVKRVTCVTMRYDFEHLNKTFDYDNMFTLYTFIVLLMKCKLQPLTVKRVQIIFVYNDKWQNNTILLELKSCIVDGLQLVFKYDCYAKL